VEIILTRDSIPFTGVHLIVFFLVHIYGPEQQFQIVLQSDHIAEKNASDWILLKMTIFLNIQKAPYLYPACFLFVPLTKNNKHTFLLHGFLNIIGIMLKLPVLL
jgi:hypothetical protein